MPGRSFTSQSYRYGFQGQETDKEMLDGSVAFKYRVHDPRIGRFLSIDPLTKSYPHYTPYSFSGNTVIAFKELEGAEPVAATQAKQQSEKIQRQNFAQIDAMVKGAMVPYRVVPVDRIHYDVYYTAHYYYYSKEDYENGNGRLGHTSQSKWQWLISDHASNHDGAVQGGWGGNSSAELSNGVTAIGVILTAGTATQFALTGRFAYFVAEEAALQLTGLPVNPKDVFDVARSVGRLTINIVEGTSRKIAVIGGGMDDVIEVANRTGAEKFQPSQKALDEWEDLKDTYGKQGEYVPEDVVKETSLYKENQDWINSVKDEGYSIIDIGYKNEGDYSTFYELEKGTIYD